MIEIVPVNMTLIAASAFVALRAFMLFRSFASRSADNDVFFDCRRDRADLGNAPHGLRRSHYY